MKVTPTLTIVGVSLVLVVLAVWAITSLSPGNTNPLSEADSLCKQLYEVKKGQYWGTLLGSDSVIYDLRTRRCMAANLSDVEGWVRGVIVNVETDQVLATFVQSNHPGTYNGLEVSRPFLANTGRGETAPKTKDYQCSASYSYLLTANGFQDEGCERPDLKAKFCSLVDDAGLDIDC